MGKKPTTYEADYDLAEFLVAVQTGVPLMVARMFATTRNGRLGLAVLLTDGRHYRELQAECAKVPDLARLSKLPREEFEVLIGLVEHEIDNM